MKATLESLIQAYLDSTATDAEVQELSALLETDAAVRQQYLDLATLHADLSSSETLWETVSAAPLQLQARPKPRWQKRAWLAAAASVAVVAGATWFAASVSPKPVEEKSFATDGPVSTPAETAPPLVVVKQSSKVRWIKPATPPAVGSALPAGKLVFDEGTLHLEFLSGAELLVQGPAEIELETDNSAWLHRGTATAYVPEPAQGFLLKTTGATVEDLGTSFGLSARQGQPPEVHVFEGEVNVMPGQGSKLLLTANQAVRVDSTTTARVPLRQSDFPKASAVAAEAAQEAKEKLGQWRTKAAELSKDPSLAAFFPLLKRNDLPEDSAMVGGGWTSGIWPGKPALEFRSRTDRLRFQAGGSFPGITLMACVRVDSLSNDYNALLLPTHYAPGSLHWTLERGGELRLTILTDPLNSSRSVGWDGPVSAPAISNMDFGRWIFLATTYDAATGQVIHYRDGREAGRGTLAHRLPALLGEMEFGNWGADGSTPDNAWWTRQPRHHKPRNFTGRLDFLAIFRQALSAERIASLAGNFE